MRPTRNWWVYIAFEIVMKFSYIDVLPKMDSKYYYTEHFELKAKKQAIESFMIGVNYDHLICNERFKAWKSNAKNYKFYLFLQSEQDILKSVINKRKWWTTISDTDLLSQADLIWDKTTQSHIYKNLPVWLQPI